MKSFLDGSFFVCQTQVGSSQQRQPVMLPMSLGCCLCHFFQPQPNNISTMIISILSTAASSIVPQRPLQHVARRSISCFSTLSHRRSTVLSNERLSPLTRAFPPNNLNHNDNSAPRFFSAPPSPPPTTTSNNLPPPTSLSPEAGLAAQDAMRLFIEHGIGKRALEAIAEDTRKVGAVIPEKPRIVLRDRVAIFVD